MIGTPRAILRDFICPRFPRHTIADVDDIFALGFVNSLFAMELVMFIEKEFHAEVPDVELDLDNFRTIDAMVGLVGRLRTTTMIGSPAAGS